VSFDPSREPVKPRDAASVILLRARAGTGAAEVFMLRRHRKASFMSSAFVFPGGAADEGDGDIRVTAARELFEEAGVLLADRGISASELRDWRERAAAGARLTELLAAAGVSWALESLHYFAHWITPSAESKRFSAQFFLAELPVGQVPSFDNRETVDEIWLTPDEALERSGELRLPPPQVRTLAEMREPAARGLTALRAAAAERARHPHPIMPRFALTPGATHGFALLLPWDPEYSTIGSGEGIEMPAGHPLGTGPSRFILDGTTWKNVAATSPRAG